MCGLGSFKEALQGQTRKGEQQGCAWPPHCHWACFTATELLGGLLGGRLAGSTLGVDVMRKGSSSQGGLRASGCWRLAQAVVLEALRPFILGL